LDIGDDFRNLCNERLRVKKVVWVRLTQGIDRPCRNQDRFNRLTRFCSFLNFGVIDIGLFKSGDWIWTYRHCSFFRVEHDKMVGTLAAFSRDFVSGNSKTIQFIQYMKLLLGVGNLFVDLGR
jgi:hypothetical protein